MNKLEKLSFFFKERPYIDLVVIPLIIFVISFFVANHINAVLIDHGREFYIPEQMLKGKVLYKDITLIYFPLGYYINALIYKLLGVSINSLLISQTILGAIYMNIYYLLSREFLSRKTSLLITLLIIFSSLFANTSFFNFITPYSYSMTYGLMFLTLSTLFIVKLFRTDNLLYAYLASISLGITLCFKFEFYIAFILLVLALFLYKRLNIKQYVMLILSFFIFPILLLLSLFMQGITWQNLYDAIDFGVKFSKSKAMTDFLSEAGMYPLHISQKIQEIVNYLPYFITVILWCFAALKLNHTYKKKYILPFFIIIIWHSFYNAHYINFYWIILPILVLSLLIVNFKKLLLCYPDKSAILMIIAGLLFSQRIFFSLTLYGYGTFALPLLLLGFIVILKNIMPEDISAIKTKSIISYILVVLIVFYSYNLFTKYTKTQYKITSSKGAIYTSEDEYSKLNFLINYIETSIKPKETLLVLPEGTFLNFITDRNVDMKCFMMDRLYHDAYGAEKAKEIIANTNSDYIILIHDNVKFMSKYPYLYEGNNSLAYLYIVKNYSVVKTEKIGYSDYTILKRNKI